LPENAIAILGTVFFMQKIIGFNRFVSWPCHFTSKLVHKKGIQLGQRSYPGWSPGCYIQARNGIIIGDNLRMGPGVCLISANHDLADYDQWVESEPIVIGSNVWLGAGVKIMPGVNIGNNVVIAANAVVTKNIPDDSIAAGVPAKVIGIKEKYRGRCYRSD
jgi:acetyltransferase-like isoleucine patch superfamily enzyme